MKCVCAMYFRNINVGFGPVLGVNVALLVDWRSLTFFQTFLLKSFSYARRDGAYQYDETFV